MSQKFTLHTHTVGFDGRNSVEEMVKRAIELGFETIGFSNHFIVHPDIKNSKMYKYAVRDGYQNIYYPSTYNLANKQCIEGNMITLDLSAIG